MSPVEPKRVLVAPDDVRTENKALKVFGYNSTHKLPFDVAIASITYTTMIMPPYKLVISS